MISYSTVVKVGSASVTVTGGTASELAAAVAVLGGRDDVVTALEAAERRMKRLAGDQPPEWWAASAEAWAAVWPQIQAGMPA